MAAEVAGVEPGGVGRDDPEPEREVLVVERRAVRRPGRPGDRDAAGAVGMATLPLIGVRARPVPPDAVRACERRADAGGARYDGRRLVDRSRSGHGRRSVLPPVDRPVLPGDGEVRVLGVPGEVGEPVAVEIGDLALVCPHRVDEAALPGARKGGVADEHR